MSIIIPKIGYSSEAMKIAVKDNVKVQLTSDSMFKTVMESMVPKDQII
jgi:hypothetical protein